MRKVVAEAGLKWSDAAPFASNRSLGEALLEPTCIYVKSTLGATRTGKVKALAHITGGGLIENIPRVLPEGARAALDAKAWELPPVFRWLAEAGRVSRDEMARTFNCGIGMVAVVAAEDAAEIARLLEGAGERVLKIGRIERTDGAARQVTIAGLERWPG